MSEQWVSGVRKCPECCKEFPVLWPTQWAYKRGLPNPKYFCSWKCLRSYDKKKEKDMNKNRRDRLEVTMQLVEAIERGEDPLDVMVTLGYGNPEQAYYDIKNWARDNQPALYEQFPKRRTKAKKQKTEKTFEEVKKSIMEIPKITVSDAMNNMKDAADEFFGKCEDMGLTIDRKNTEPKQIEYKVTGIDTEMGSFRYFKRSGYLDWDAIGDNDTVSMNVDEWRQLIRDLPKIMEILGVKE